MITNDKHSAETPPQPYARVAANIIVAIFFFAFNLIGLPTYASAYDQFLIIVGLGFNVLTVWSAWKWPKQERVEATP